MNRALALLTCGGSLTLLLGVLGSDDPVPPTLLGAAFTVLGTVGYAWVRRGAGTSRAGILAGE